MTMTFLGRATTRLERREAAAARVDATSALTQRIEAELDAGVEGAPDEGSGGAVDPDGGQVKLATGHPELFRVNA